MHAHCNLYTFLFMCLCVTRVIAGGVLLRCVVWEMQIQPGVSYRRFPRRHLPQERFLRSSLLLWLLLSPVPFCSPPRGLHFLLFPLVFFHSRAFPHHPFFLSPPLSSPSSLFSASLSGSRSSGKPGTDLRSEHDLRTRSCCAGSAGGSEVPGCSVPLPSRPRLLLGAAALCKCPARAARWGSWPEGLAGGLARSAPARVFCLSGSPVYHEPPACLVLCLSGPLVCPGPLPHRGQPATLLPVVWRPSYTWGAGCAPEGPACTWPGWSAPAPPGGPGWPALRLSFPVLEPGIGLHCTPCATPLAHNSASRTGCSIPSGPEAQIQPNFAVSLE